MITLGVILSFLQASYISTYIFRDLLSLNYWYIFAILTTTIIVIVANKSKGVRSIYEKWPKSIMIFGIIMFSAAWLMYIYFNV